MQEKIALFGTTLERFSDEEIELEVFPNRPDLLSYHSFKRSFLAFLGKKKGIEKYDVKKPEKDYRVIIDSSVEQVRPFTACAIVRGLNLNDERIREIIDLQEKLHATVGRRRKKLAIGVYPLDAITLPITYKAVEGDKIRFRPLEAPREMSGLEILQRHPTGKEYAHLLAGKDKFPLFVDAKEQVLSMPPIINAESTGRVGVLTKDVFVECSGFDFQTLSHCLAILVTALADMGGTIYQMTLEYKKKVVTPDLSFQESKVSLNAVNALLGENFSEKDIKEYLERMGHEYKKGSVLSPAWRMDLLHEVDFIEDVAIAHGYDSFEPIIPHVFTIGEEDSKTRMKKKIADILVGLGLLEVSNYHLTTKKDQFTAMGINEKHERGILTLQDSKTDYKLLRNDLAHYLMKNFSENVDVDYPQRIFEIGRIFVEKKEIHEEEHVALGIAPGNFTEAKQMVEYVFRMLDKKVSFTESKTPLPFAIDGRVADLVIDKRVVGYIGEVHPKVLRQWKLRMPVALCEFSIDELV